jgi:hypothetical protein
MSFSLLSVNESILISGLRLPHQVFSLNDLSLKSLFVVFEALLYILTALLRDKLEQRCVQWLHYDVDVPSLVDERVARRPIEEGRHCETQLLLNVSLLVVLLHLVRHPPKVSYRVLGWMRMV